MCGRFTLMLTWKELVALSRLATPGPEFEVKPTWNFAPSQKGPIITADTIKLAKWGIRPHWMTKAGPINARCETVATNACFRSAFKARRCVVPATGWYEWRQGTPKVPHYIHRADGQPVLFAGLWEEGEIPTFAIVTCDANEDVLDVHNRMPVTIADMDAWMRGTPDDAKAVLVPAPPGALIHHPVSSRVNTPRNNDAGLTEAI